jgi:hypothetical protein
LVRKLAAQFLALAQKQTATAPRMIGHRLVGMSLLHTGDIAEGRTHFALANALYDPVEHRPLATRFGQDVGVAILFWKSLSLWLLGYPEAALADADDALKGAREIGQAATLMYTLTFTLWIHILRGNYAAVSAQADEGVALADEKGSLLWGPFGITCQGCISAMIGKALDAVQMIPSALTGLRTTGTTFWMPLYLPHFARAYAELDRFNDAWRSDDGDGNNKGKAV